MKKTIMSIIIIILLTISAIIFFITRNQTQSIPNSEVTFIFNKVDGANVSLYQNKSQTSTKGSLGEKITDLSPNITLSLPRNKNYIAKVSGDGIKEYNSIVYLNNSKVKHRLYISRTDQYLASIKRAEAEEIITSANNQLQKWMRLYSISSDNLKIVDDGTWAVIKLDYRGNTVLNRDSLFAILHKDLNEWKVVANPEIVVSKIDHPNIPSSAILEASPVAPPAK